MLDYFFGLFSHDIGIDLGTANTLVLVRGKGIVIREPSIVAQHKKTKQILAIGSEAKKMVGKTPATIVAIRPLRDGVISDFEVTEKMLTTFIHKVHERPGSILPSIPKPRVAVGIPSGVTEVERRAVQDAALSAGARVAYLVEEPMAAAIGVGLPITEPMGNMVVDMGGGTTEVAVISLGGIVVNRSIRIAGDELDQDIINYLRLRYGLLIGEKTAEEVKIAIGSAWPLTEIESEPGKTGKERDYVARGRDLETGLPKSIRISSSEVREAISGPISVIVQSISDTIEETPPELVSDILERGITLCGGGALLPGLAHRIAKETKMPVWVADDPLTCVVRGCARVLEEKDLLERVRVIGGLR